MKQDTRQAILWVVKWGAVSIIAAIAFYQASPKYFFTDKGRTRCNRISGKVEMWRDVDDNTGTLKFGKQPPKKPIGRKIEIPVLPDSFFDDLDEDYGYEHDSSPEKEQSYGGKYARY